MPRGQRLDLTGQRIGRLFVAESAGGARFRCVCDCGAEVIRTRSAIADGGEFTSCGCARLAGLELRRTHGEAAHGVVTPEYKAWHNIKQRCENPRERSFRNYGARGVYICDGWRERFDAFLADVGRRPTDGHSIDRVDNDGSYTCGRCADCVAKGAAMNCKWSTLSEQNCNRRGNRKVTARGETLTIAEWSRKTGIPHETITARLRRGATGEEALMSRPPDKRRGRKCPRRNVATSTPARARRAPRRAPRPSARRRTTPRLRP